MGFYYKLIIFLIVNFGALWLGGILQGEGARSNWYLGLDIAPWTPPGWVFGVAWVSIMLCFSLFMAYTADFKAINLLMALFLIQLIMNVSWNAIFFRYHMPGFSLLVILLLTITIGIIFFTSFKAWPQKSLLLLPYLIWLILATSLNWYAWIKN